MEHQCHPAERAAVESILHAAIVGSDGTVQAGLEKLASDTRADEVIVVTDTYEHSDRIDSYQPRGSHCRKNQIATECRAIAFYPSRCPQTASGRKLQLCKEQGCAAAFVAVTNNFRQFRPFQLSQLRHFRLLAFVS